MKLKVTLNWKAIASSVAWRRHNIAKKKQKQKKKELFVTILR